MGAVEIVLFILLLVLCWAASVGVRAAYQNGVTDGYGYSREQRNPGYQKAGHLLRMHMAHRWPELKRRIEEEKAEEWE